LIRDSKTQGQTRTGEKVFVVFTLLLSTGAFLNLSVGGPIQSPNTGMVGMQILWTFVYAVVLILCARNSISPIRAAVNVAPLLAVVILALASTAWSQAPMLSARRAIALGLTLLFGVYFATRFELKDQFRLLAITCAICIVLSFAFELLQLNPDEGIPGWYGIFYQKNSLGRNMVLSALVFLFWQRLEPEYKWRARLGLILSGGLVVLARSATSLLVLLLLLCLLPYVRWSLRKNLLWASSGIALLVAMAVPAMVWAATHLEVVAGGLGRDPLFTGRVPLWILSSAAALQRPLLGFGFEAFWLPDQALTQRIWQVLVWRAPHAHNGFLELWLEVGLCGVALFAGGFLYYVAKALRFSYRQRPEPGAAWPLLFLLFILLSNLTESSLLSANSIYFILYVSVASLLSNTVPGQVMEDRSGLQPA
jgi:exopolysaccharide production protein ExoQ